MARRGGSAFITLCVVAALISILAAASYQSGSGSDRTTSDARSTAAATPAYNVPGPSNLGTGDAVDRAAREAFHQAGIADDLEERFGELKDAESYLAAIQELRLDGVGRVDHDVLARQLRLEGRLVNGVPPDSCVSIGMGVVSVEVVDDVLVVLRAMPPEERDSFLDVGVTLVKASITEQPLRPRLTGDQVRRAEESFLALFAPAELDQLTKLAPVEGRRLGDVAACRIVRLMYDRLVTLPDDVLGLVAAYLVEVELKDV